MEEIEWGFGSSSWSVEVANAERVAAAAEAAGTEAHQLASELSFSFAAFNVTQEVRVLVCIAFWGAGVPLQLRVARADSTWSPSRSQELLLLAGSIGAMQAVMNTPARLFLSQIAEAAQNAAGKAQRAAWALRDAFGVASDEDD